MDEIADVTHKMSLVKITGHKKSNKFKNHYSKVRVLEHYGGQNTILVTGVFAKTIKLCNGEVLKQNYSTVERPWGFRKSFIFPKKNINAKQYNLVWAMTSRAILLQPLNNHNFFSLDQKHSWLGLDSSFLWSFSSLREP